MGVAKGTFYYYFKSKDEILTAIADAKLDEIIEQAEQVADAADLNALQKMEMLLADSRVGEVDTDEITDMLHLPENRELHELVNVKTVWRLSPILARIIEQGNKEGQFDVAHPLATIQILLTGGHFLLDGGLFYFSDEETSNQKTGPTGDNRKVIGRVKRQLPVHEPGRLISDL